MEKKIRLLYNSCQEKSAKVKIFSLRVHTVSLGSQSISLRKAEDCPTTN